MSAPAGVRVTAAAATFDLWRGSPAGLAVPAGGRMPDLRPADPAPVAVSTAFGVFAGAPVTVSLVLTDRRVQLVVHAAAQDDLAALVVRVGHAAGAVPDWVQTVLLPLERAGEEAIAWARTTDPDGRALERVGLEVCHWAEGTVRTRVPLADRSSWRAVAAAVVAALRDGEARP